MNLSEVHTLKNYTPHEVAVLVKDSFIRIPAYGEVARMSTHCEFIGCVKDMPIHMCEEGVVRGLPEPEPGVMYIVSSVVARAVRRSDVIAPDTSDDGAIRDGNGSIIGVKRFQMFA